MAAWTDMITIPTLPTWISTLPTWALFIPALLPLLAALIFYVKIKRTKSQVKRNAKTQQVQNLSVALRLTRDIIVVAKDNEDQQEAFIRGLLQLLNKLNAERQQ